ncbi:hypothetical protein QBC38DRAFT_523523 [Podospora fimiseda]|uniref:Ubiquitin 3 binding protein But2 C-terminal domain-containing protein n=1 Tax=Podospora fimiseda TaxID=252190 RepID=A0AAN7BSE6_9PEZI|nr:hypothetical protein QBC38DRAFT_523523 [Podospora fimiseda]
MLAALLFLGIFSFFAFTASTADIRAPIRPPLKPLHILTLTTFAPSGRPDSYPTNSAVNISASDPNSMTVIACATTWPVFEYATVWNRINPCSESSGATKNSKWTFQLLTPTASGQGASPLWNFRVHFVHETEKGIYVATGKFGVDDGNLSGLCSASGVCSFVLKGDNVTVPLYRLER